MIQVSLASKKQSALNGQTGIKDSIWAAIGHDWKEAPAIGLS